MCVSRQRKRKTYDGMMFDDNKKKIKTEKNHLESLISITMDLSESVSKLSFTKPTHTYNPLEYAWKSHKQYLKLITKEKKGSNSCEGKVLLLGMNPGPWGMVQTGIPFGTVDFVSKWMKINDKIETPSNFEQHPKRPILGFKCKRKEISGTRLYSWASQTFGTENSNGFFDKFFILNYCPLYFIQNVNGKNLVPERLNKNNKHQLFEICDDSLIKIINLMKPSFVIGIGNFANKKALHILSEMIKLQQNEIGNTVYTGFMTGKILHPSPANPKACNWDIDATKQLNNIGVVW